jgi:pimeloyl-ACP methyl ester carboxylesterase
MQPAIRQRFRLFSGAEMSVVTAGDASKPAVLLLHGFPGSSTYFRDVIPKLSQTAFVIAPDLPGFGESDVLPRPSFPAFGQAISELLNELAIGPRYLYLHDFGAPAGFHIAMQAPEKVLGLIIQNANAHQSGLGPDWTATREFWANPTPKNEAKATTHLTLEGMRAQYIAKVPPEIAALIPPARWEEDWRVMQLPGRLEMQRALLADYAHYVARFDRIADYLERWQPRALLLWGRHDAFFALAETLSWTQALPRMETHLFDAGHLLLETHAVAATSLMFDFVGRSMDVGRRESPTTSC